ncbi:helix-turn-helix domain-containing protein [Anaerotalea alkaliphila]|uniref:AraC family transcriptional regulator n=1 Tax=Anaerotalea alkaliphila TaxID=2662126 RepID=A0A7X5KN45_9FIRM|nr:helix-turn-helix domain-containing protein [Anaerotalea alkaliphila]NDL67398.1 AraC family transcriptional regulator [Anaerotalea alkaliphila]
MSRWNSDEGMSREVLQETLSINGQFYVEYIIYALEGSRRYEEVHHTHPSLELSMIREGRGHYRIGGREYDVGPGDVFIINNTESHGLEMAREESLTNVVIHFEPRFVWSEPNHFDGRFLDVFFERNQQFSHRLDPENPVTEEIRRLFGEIGDEFGGKRPAYELMVKVKLLNILVLLIRHYGYVRKDESPAHLQELAIIRKVTDYIDNRYVEEISLGDLAAIANMNPSYFSTFFKRYNGMSPSEYILRKRITHAMSYIRATDGTILEIALKSGFNTVANFNKQFKKVTGMSPTLFRNSQNPSGHAQK